MSREEVPEAEILNALLEIAPNADTFIDAARGVNVKLDLDWSDAMWRGWKKRHPSEAETVYKATGIARKNGARRIAIGGNVRGVVVSDIHSPYHDTNAINLLCKVTRWYAPDVFIYNGDSADFYGLSKFDRNPERKFTVQDEIDLLHVDVFAPIKYALPTSARVIKTIGNHEDRLRRLIWQNPGLYGLRSLTYQELFELPRFGIELAEYAVEFSDLLQVSHGTVVRKWSGYSGKAEVEKRRYRWSTITGHVHRQGRFETTHRDAHIIGQEGACMCTLSPEYIEDPDWVQGFTLFEIHEENLSIQPITITGDYTCVIGTKKFSV